MIVRFWGTRGSLPKPGPGTVRYGGNTSYVEVRSSSGTIVVLDCGTGAHGLGQAMAEEAAGEPIRGAMLITHTHWDHIQGIPFFAPFFGEDNSWDVYAPHGLSQSLRETLAGQMQYVYFPITLEELGATIRYHDLVEGVFDYGDIRIRARYLNHTALTLGYRLEADGFVVAYACDHEPVSQQAAPDPDNLGSREERHVNFLRDADLVIHDAQYSAAEYPKKIGWGHSTAEYAAAVCQAAGAKRLALTSHDPTRDDDGVDRMLAAIRADVAVRGQPLEVFAAAEGQTVDLGAAARSENDGDVCEFSAVTQVNRDITANRIFLGRIRPAAQKVIREAAAQEHIEMVCGNGGDTSIRSILAARPSLIVLDANEAPEETVRLSRQIREEWPKDYPQAPIVVIADAELGDALGVSDKVTDWLVWPFSEQYARTKIRAWVLRIKCRWLRAQLPQDEESRLAALHGLGILDTEPEDRFDRITRIASEAFGAPISLVSFIDRDRQWFKSSIGMDRRETSREMAFCAHAILEDRVLVVPDTEKDERFADNPLVTGEPHVRFYAGCPLKTADDELLGTLCVIDMKPRAFDRAQIELLRDLASLVEKELSPGPQQARRLEAPADPP